MGLSVNNGCNLELRIYENDSVSLSVGEMGNPISLQIGETGFPVYPEPYRGKYTVTPSQNEQTLKTKGLMALENVIVEKIPNCYGLVEWNGSFLKIS